MSSHTDGMVNRVPLTSTDRLGCLAESPTTLIKEDWFEHNGNAVDAKVWEWLKSLKSLKSYPPTPPTSPERLASHLPPSPPEYVVTLTYGLDMSYRLDGNSLIRMNGGTSVVMDALHTMHGVEDVGGGEGVEFGGRYWRVGVVGWRRLEREGREEEGEEVEIGGLFGDCSEEEG